MAAERKLKSEIDRTLKKVQEGQDVFEDLWNQVHETDNQNQREKLEAELKKEIKKLQRLREQIKSWIAGADIKDKQPLMDARKSIERDMERFKACEKEAKMKGGVGGGKANDPKEKAKEDARDWINSTVDSITSKVEELEYEVEELQGNIKKKQKPPPRLAELDELVGRHKEHIQRLEKVLRCIDNETIQPEELEDLKNDMEAYLSGDEDSGIDFTNVDDFYSALSDRMESVDAAAPPPAIKGVHGLGGKGGKDRNDEAERERHEKERERERAAAAAAKAQLMAQAGAQASHLRTGDDHHDDSASSAASAAGGASPLPPGGLAALVAGGASSLNRKGSLQTPTAASASSAGKPGAPAAAATGATPVAAGGTALAAARGLASAVTPSKTSAAGQGGAVTGEPPGFSSASEAGPLGASGQATPSGMPSTPRGVPGQASTSPSVDGPSPAPAARAPYMATGQGFAAPLGAAGAAALSASAAAGTSLRPGAATGATAGPGSSWLSATTGAAAAAGDASSQKGKAAPGAAIAGAVPQGAPGASAATAKPGGTPLQQGAKPGGGQAATGPLSMMLKQAAEQQQAAGAQQSGPKDGSQSESVFPGQPTEGVMPAAVPQDGKGPVSAKEVDALAAQMAAAKGLSLGSLDAADRESLLRAAAAAVAAGATGASAIGSEAAAGAAGMMATLQPAVPAFTVPAAKLILEGCFGKALPQASDLDWKRYKPRHPTTVPASYPRMPHDVMDNPMLFRKVDPEVLFFAFYFQPDTYQQYLAAHELKRQSWRFHKHHYAWFQRFTEPTVTSEEYEQGAYVYFDYNIVHDDMQTGWCYRRKENFTFRYDALEDELRV